MKPHVSEYTAQEIATLSSRLEKQLGPEYISSRPGAGGGKVHYLSADKCINLANEVFGFNGWSSGIQNVQIDFVSEGPVRSANESLSPRQVDENQSTGKVSLGLSVVVRVTLRDGTYHEVIFGEPRRPSSHMLKCIRTSGTDISRIAKAKLQLLRKQRRRGRLMG